MLAFNFLILVRSKAATSITIPYIVVHTPDLRSPSPVRVRGCRLVVARLRIGTRPRAPCNGHPSPLPGVAWRSAPLNVQTWANRGSSARWAAARGSLRSSRRALTRWAIGSRARPSSAVHSCSGFRAGHCPKKTRQAESEALLVSLPLSDTIHFVKGVRPDSGRCDVRSDGHCMSPRSRAQPAAATRPILARAWSSSRSGTA